MSRVVLLACAVAVVVAAACGSGQQVILPAGPLPARALPVGSGWGDPSLLRPGSQTGQVTAAFPAGTPLPAIRQWADHFELTEQAPALVRLQHVFTLPTVQVAPQAGGRALLVFPWMIAPDVVDEFISSRHLTVTRWLRDEGTGVPGQRDRVALVELPRLQVSLEAVAGQPGLYEARLPTDLGLTEADVRQLVADQAPGYDFAGWDPATGVLLVRRPRPQAYPVSYTVIPYVRAYTPPKTRTYTPLKQTPQPPAAPPPNANVQVYVQFVAGTAPVELQRVMSKYGLTAATTGGMLAVASVPTLRVNGVLQLLSGEPSVQCAALSANPCGVNQLPGAAQQATAAAATPPTGPAPAILRSLPAAAGIVRGTVHLEVDARTAGGNGAVDWQLTGARGSIDLGGAPIVPSATDPTAWTASLDWDTSKLADGTYTLVATVTGGSGTPATVSQRYDVENAAPSAPTALSATAGPNGETLSWQQPAVAGAAYYRLSRDGQQITEMPSDRRSFVDAAPAPGQHTYSLVLVGADGQQSPAAIATGSFAGAPASSHAVGLSVLLPSGQPLRPEGLAPDHVLLVADVPAGAVLAGFQSSTDGGTTWSPLAGAPAGCAGRCSQSWTVPAAAGSVRVRALTAAGDASQPFVLVVAPAPGLEAPTPPVLDLQPFGVDVSWSMAPGVLPAGYQLERDAGLGWEILDIIGRSTYEDRSAAAGSHLAYRVRALDGDGNPGDPSTAAAIDVPAAAGTRAATSLAAAPGVRAVAASGHVTLLWQSVTGAGDYRVDRAWSADGPYNPVGTTAGTLFVDPAPPLGGEAFYRVVALGGGAVGAPSDVVAALLLPATAPIPLPAGAGAGGALPLTPPAPGSVQAVVESDGIRVTWTAPQSGVLTYRVYRFDPATLSFALAADGLTGTSFLDAGLGAAASYGYAVTAVDAYGQESSYSPAAWVDLPASPAQDGILAPVLTAPVAAPAGSTLTLQASVGGSPLDLANLVFAVAPAAGPYASIATLGGAGSSLGGPADAGQLAGGAWSAIWNTQGLAAGAYTLRVQVEDVLGRMSQALQAVRLDAPPARGPPAGDPGLQASGMAGGVELTWSAGPGAQVQVLRSTDGPNGPFEVVTQTTAASFDDRHLIPGAAYSYLLETAQGSSEVATATPLPGSTGDSTLTVGLPPSSAGRLTLDVAPVMAPPALPRGLVLVGSAYTIDATSLSTGAAVHLLNQWARLTFHVPAGLDGPLGIYHWDGTQWLSEGRTASGDGTFTAEVDHFSTFAVAAGTVDSSSGSTAPPPTSTDTGGTGRQSLPQLPPPPPALQVAADGEVTSLRTATSRTYLNPDGTFRRVLSSGLVNFQDASGAWRTIDTSLVGAGDGTGDTVSAAGPLQVRLPRDFAGRPVQVSAGGDTLSMRLQGAQSSGLSAAGSEGSYASVQPGVDVTYSVAPDTLNESVVLRSRPGGPVSFTFLLAVSAGLTLAARPDGSIDALDASGGRVFLIPAPLLTEPAAAGGVGAQSAGVAVSLTGAAGHYRLTYTPDLAWLQDPARRYPVVLDPSVTLGGAIDAEIDAALPNDTFPVTDMAVGKDVNGGVYRMLVGFGSGWPCDGCYATSATLHLYESQAWHGAGNGLLAWMNNRGWGVPVSWNGAPGTNGPTASSATLGGTGWLTFDVTAAIQNWELNVDTNDGFTIESSNEGGGANDVAFASHNTSTAPYVSINYDTYLYTLATSFPAGGTWIPSNGTLQAQVVLQNIGTATWASDVRLSYRWVQNGNNLTNFDPRVFLPVSVAPSASIVLRFTINAPSAVVSGGIQLQFSLVRENVFWFYNLAWGNPSHANVVGVNMNVADESATIAGSGLPAVILAQPSGQVTIPLTLTNTSNYYTWHASDTNDLVRIGMRNERTISGGLLPVDESRTWLPHDVGPGQSVNVSAVLEAPGDPGDYWFRVDLFRESVTWFEDRANQPLEVHVRVVAPGDAQAGLVPVTQNDGTQVGVNSANGFLTLYATDLSVPELGSTQLLLSRTFNGINAGLPAAGTASSSATYGIGWTFSFQRSIQLGAWAGTAARFSTGLYTDIRGKSWVLTWNPGRGLWEDAAGDRTVSVTGAADAVPVDLVQRNGAALATDASAPRGSALLLEGATPAALVFPGARVPTQQSGSLELWFRPDFAMATDTAEHDVFADTTGRFKLSWNASGHAQAFCFTTVDTDTGTTDNLCSAATVWTTGTWHHIGVTWQAGGAKTLVLDQGSALVNATHGQSPTGDLYVGFSPAGGTDSLAGAIAELRLENQAVSASTLQADGAPGTKLSGDAGTLYLGTFVDSVNSTAGRLTITNPDQTQEDFDPDTGRLLAERDRVGNQIDYVWDASGRISQVVDHQLTGRKLTFAYAPDPVSGTDITVTDPGGRTVLYVVNAGGDLVSVQRSDQVPDPLTGTVSSQPITTAYAYLPGHQLQTITDPRGSVTTFRYQGYQQAVIGDGPVAFWRLDDGAGGTAADRSGSRLNGVIQGAVGLGNAGLVPGYGGHSMTFDGFTQFIQAPSIPALQGGSARTVELWLKTWDGNSDMTLFNSGNLGVNGQAFNITLRTSGSVGGNPPKTTPGLYVELWGDDVYVPDLNLTDGNPHYVAVTLSGAAMSVYVDGTTPAGTVWNGTAWSAMVAQPFTLPLATNTFAGQVTIGGVPDAPQIGGATAQELMYQGTLDEVAIYNTALTAARVQAHRTAGAGYRAAVLADHPVAYYGLDETTGAIAFDSSGANDAGTVTGGVTTGAPGLLTTDPDRAMTFDGSTGTVAAATVPALQGDNARSVELWLQTASTAQQAFFDSGAAPGAGGQAFALALTQQNGVGGSPAQNTPGLYFTTYGADVYLPGLNLADGHPHHIVVTLTGSTVGLYVDGRAPPGFVTNSSGNWLPLASGPFGLSVTPNTVANPIWIGHARQAFWGVGSAYFTGTIGDVAIYPYALTAAQVLAHYTAGAVYPQPARVASVQDARLNTVLTLAYDDAAGITTVTDGVGATSTYTYQTPGGRSVSYTDPMGHVTTNVWDSSASYRLVATVDPTGVRHSRVYNSSAPVGQRSQVLLEDVANVPADTFTNWVVGGGLLPVGSLLATTNESWVWDPSVELWPGVSTHESLPQPGVVHQHYFSGGAAAGGQVVPETTAIQWIYIEAGQELPDEIMIQFHVTDPTAWEHRAFWGFDQIGWGTSGTASRRFQGGLPAAGRWVPLLVPLGPSENGALDVDVANRNLDGLAFTVLGGSARVWWGPFELDMPGDRVSDPTRAITTHAYDQQNDLIATVDPNGIATVTDYDAHGLPIQVATGVRPSPPALLASDPVSDPSHWTNEFGFAGTSTGTDTFQRGGVGSLTQSHSDFEQVSSLYRDFGGLLPGTEVQVSVWATTQYTYQDLGLAVDDGLAVPLAQRRTAFTDTGVGQWVQLTLPFVVDTTGDVRVHLVQREGLGTTDWADVRIADITPAPDVTFARPSAVYLTDFEQPGDRSTWQQYLPTPASSSLEMLQDKTRAHGGQWVAHESASVNNDGLSWYRDTTVAPGVSYHVGVWVRAVASGSQTGTGMPSLWVHSPGTSLSVTAVASQLGRWQLLSVDTPAWYGTMRVELTQTNFRGDSYFDDLTVTASGGLPPGEARSAYPQVVAGDSPFAFYRLNDQGNAVRDASGGANWARAAGGVTFGAPGLSGSGAAGMTFDGSTGVVQAPPLEPLSWSNDRSVELWFKTSSTSAQPLVDSAQDGYIGQTFEVYLTQPNSVWVNPPQNTAGILVTFGNDDVYLPGLSLADGHAHHLVVTLTGSTVWTYVDGRTPNGTVYNYGTQSWSAIVAQPFTLITGPVTDFMPLLIGHARALPLQAGSQWFNGTISDVAVYPTVLPAARVQAHLTAGTGYQQAVLADKPTAYYPLSDQTAVADTSGHGNQATWSGGVAGNVPGIVGTDTAMTFDGATGSVQAPSLLPLQGDNARSVEVWLQTSYTGQQAFLDAGGTGTNGQSFEIGLTQSGGVGGSPVVNTPGLYIVLWGDDVFVPGLGLADGRPHQLVVTLSGSSMQVYVDGRQPAGLVWQGSGWSTTFLPQPFALPVTPGTAANPLLIGRGRLPLANTGSAYFKGTLGEVAVYDHVLTAAQVQAHYGGGWLGATSGSGAATWTASGTGGVGGGPARRVTVTATAALGDVTDRLPVQTLRTGASYVVSAWLGSSVAGSTVDVSLRDAAGNVLPVDHPTACAAGTVAAPALCENSLTYTGADQALVYLTISYGGQGVRDVYLSHPLVALQAMRTAYSAAGQVTDVSDVFGRDTATTYDASGLYPVQVVERQTTAGASLTTAFTYDAVGHLTSTTAISGSQQITDLNQIDSWGRVTATIQNYRSGVQADAQTNVRTGFRYDANGNLTDQYEQSATAGGYVDTHSDYDAGGNRYDQVLNFVSGQGQTAAQNVKTTYVFDVDGRLVDELDPVPGCVTSCATVDRRTLYDAAGRVTDVIDNFGGAQDVSQANVDTQYFYDDAGRVIDIGRPVSQAPAGQAPLAGMVEDCYAYDALGRQVNVDHACGTPSWMPWQDAFTAYTLDAGGRITDVFGPGTGSAEVSVVTHTEYDDLGRPLTTAVDPGGLDAVTRYVYDPRGATHVFSPPTQQLPGGAETSTYFDLTGLTTKVVQDEIPGAPIAPDVNVTATTAYDGFGRPTDVIDPRGIVTHTDYDALDRPVDTVLDPTGLDLVTSYVYDLAGNRVQTISPRDGGARTDVVQYDALHRVIATIQNFVSGHAADFQTNITTATTYDQAGHVLTAQDPLGRVTATSYDPMGRTSSRTQNCVGSAFGVCDGAVTADQNVTTRWTYDAAGDMLTEIAARTGGTDSAHLVTAHVYDELFRQVEVIQDQGSAAAGHQNAATQFGYDNSGNLLTVTDGLGHVTTTAVDDLGRPVTVTDASGNVQRTSYSLAGEVLSTVDGRNQTNAYTRDRMGRTASVAFVHADGTAGTLSYGYDADGDVISFQASGGSATTVTYDDAGRVTQVQAPSGTTSYTYFLDGATKTAADPTGTTTFTEDQLGRPASTRDPLDGTALTIYAFDAASRLTQRTEATGLVTQLGYNGVDELTTKTVKVSGAGSPFASWTSVYDAGWNTTQETSVLPGDTLAGQSSFTYDTLNQLATASLPTQPAKAYAFDAAQNRCLTALAATAVTCATTPQTGWTTYGFGLNEALLTSTTSGTVTTFGTDADGNQLHDAQGHQLRYDSLDRLEQVYDATGATLLASYTYDAIGRLTQRVQGTSTTRFVYRGLEDQVVQELDGSSNVLRAYAWDDLGRMLTATVAGSGTYGVLTDPHGDVVGLATGTGTVAGWAHYDPWGATLASGGVRVPFGYQGGWTDSLTGLVRMGLRWYDPVPGRFTSEDPRAPNAPMTWQYANNDPLTFVDPFGLSPQGSGGSGLKPYDVTGYGACDGTQYQCHHGILDKWASEVLGIEKGLAGVPTMVLDPADHRKTFGILNKWYAQQRKAQGQSPIDWKGVSEQEIRQLAEAMFDAAGVPLAARNDYYQKWDAWRKGLPPSQFTLHEPDAPTGPDMPTAPSSPSVLGFPLTQPPGGPMPFPTPPVGFGTPPGPDLGPNPQIQAPVYLPGPRATIPEVHWVIHPFNVWPRPAPRPFSFWRGGPHGRCCPGGPGGGGGWGPVGGGAGGSGWAGDPGFGFDPGLAPGGAPAAAPWWQGAADLLGDGLQFAQGFVAVGWDMLQMQAGVAAAAWNDVTSFFSAPVSVAPPPVPGIVEGLVNWLAS
jgi:RHS repeat-associated protein